MSGAAAIDTRSQNHFMKQKNKIKTKVKQTKKQKNVAVRVCRSFYVCFAYIIFAFIFAFALLFFP